MDNIIKGAEKARTNFLRIIGDAGHGFYTKGKESKFNYLKSKAFYGKPVLKENNFNEAICNKVSVLNRNFNFITNEWWDVSLKERMKRENLLYEKGKTIFVSIHADAFETTKPRGTTVHYFSKKGKKIAYLLSDFLKEKGHELPIRKPLMSNFYVLRNSFSPAILIEAGFMTNPKDLEYLLSETFRNRFSERLSAFFWQLDPSIIK